MTDLVESSSWTPGIRQFETSDPVEGGPDGIDNVPLRQLANRTRFLKDRQEAHEGAVDPYPQYATKADLAQKVAALVDQSPEALNTLRELANALGNDPSFATTVTNALAQKAPIESPVFTGTPKGTTPGQFDNSTRLVTTAALMRDRFGFSGFTYYNGSAALPAAALGSVIDCAVGAGPYTLTLPTLSASMAGAAIKFVSYTPSAVTISTGSAVKIWCGVNGGNSGTTITLQNGDSATLTTDGYGWFVIDGSVLLPATALFGASLTTNGYQKLPSGLIVQWMTGAVVTANADNTIPFPIAFPNRVFAITSGVGYTNGSGQVNGYVSVSVTPTLSNFIARISGSTPSGVNFVALGN
ncbi:gp53-like domain-containing protein [Burkholderia stagnalis]|uniref:gp53-like domain-containing protein n=1 Tax=Burkholderia stagnalis TaxID=1503054 RepID=UPI000F56E8B3|nr:hypothetical protein [Burkholderia stagnalis]RQQ49540.1 hypothetical protein DF145_15080 [Burkholderia stagnalis]RQY00423.1 hypothetical protein DF121_15050 [Burkholderia stagnalis]RQY15682.1 hypothetical protein DF115_17210 [Burkholderia stagnalis]RQY29810.1 hypothetical protein DF114_17820 [Burkholderia stagnalis]